MMMNLLATTLGRFRIIAFIEGVSFVVLLFIAMPLKYMMGMPEAVRITGMAHGLLFVLFMFLLLQSSIEYGWRIKKIALLFLLSIVPFGTFWAEKKILSQEIDSETKL